MTDSVPATQRIARSAFWGSLGLVVYTYAGFPLLTAARAWLRPRPPRTAPITPSLSMVIAAHNEERSIKAKLENALGVNYPPDLLEILVVSDGSLDTTEAVVAGFEDRGVRLLALPRQGKNAALNAGVAATGGEIVVVSDADSLLSDDALLHLMAPFADETVGCVGGDFRYTPEPSTLEGQRAYWGLERTLKSLQSRSGSTTGVSGALFAVRRTLCAELPPDVADDFFLAGSVLAARRRVVFAPQATAHGRLASRIEREFDRKVRIITTGLRAVIRLRTLLSPRRHGLLAVQLLSHKVLRRLMVLPMISMAVSGFLLRRRATVYRCVAAAHLLLHALAIAGFALRHARVGGARPLALPMFVDMTNLAALKAIANLAGGHRRAERLAVWSPDRDEPAPGSTNAPEST